MARAGEEPRSLVPADVKARIQERRSRRLKREKERARD